MAYDTKFVDMLGYSLVVIDEYKTKIFNKKGEMVGYIEHVLPFNVFDKEPSYYTKIEDDRIIYRNREISGETTSEYDFYFKDGNRVLTTVKMNCGTSPRLSIKDAKNYHVDFSLNENILEINFGVRSNGQYKVESFTFNRGSRENTIVYSTRFYESKSKSVNYSDTRKGREVRISRADGKIEKRTVEWDDKTKYAGEYQEFPGDLASAIDFGFIDISIVNRLEQLLTCFLPFEESPLKSLLENTPYNKNEEFSKILPLVIKENPKQKIKKDGE